MKPCYCGHDCSRCITYLATIRQDEALRKESQRFYQEHFHRELPLAEISCLGGRSNQVMPLCRECPFARCCREKGLDSCSACPVPCREYLQYRKKYVNGCLQIEEESFL